MSTEDRHEGNETCASLTGDGPCDCMRSRLTALEAELHAAKQAVADEYKMRVDVEAERDAAREKLAIARRCHVVDIERFVPENIELRRALQAAREALEAARDIRRMHHCLASETLDDIIAGALKAMGTPGEPATVADFLNATVAECDSVLARYEDDGDWYSCLKHARNYLAECQRSAPPSATEARRPKAATPTTPTPTEEPTR